MNGLSKSMHLGVGSSSFRESGLGAFVYRSRFRMEVPRLLDTSCFSASLRQDRLKSLLSMAMMES